MYCPLSTESVLSFVSVFSMKFTYAVLQSIKPEMTEQSIAAAFCSLTKFVGRLSTLYRSSFHNAF